MKRILVLIVSLVLTISIFSGCGSKKTAAGSASGAATGNTSDLTWKKNTSPVKLSVYIDFNWYAVDTWGKDDVSKEITKETGVSLDVTKASDQNQLQVLLASGQLPDLVFTANQVDRFENSDVSYSFDELAKKYCPEFLNAIDPVQLALNTCDDGHVYDIKTHYLSDKDFKDSRALESTGDTGFYVRQDILNAIGNPKIDSLEDLLNVYKAVKQKYPKMIMYLPHTGWGTPFMEYMGFNSQLPYRDDSGNIKQGWEQPGYVDFLKFYNELYRDGYVSQEAFTYKPEQFTQIMNSGNVFSASYNTGLADTENKFYDQNHIKAHLVPITKALTYNGQTKFAPVDGGIGWASLFITKNCKDPKRAMLFAEFLMSEQGRELTQWGVKGKQWVPASNGLIKHTDYYNSETPEQSGVPYWYFMAGGLDDSISSSSKAISNPQYHSQLDLMQFRKKYYKRDPVLAFVTPKADTDEFDINTKLQNLYTNSEVSIITAPSETEVETRYNQFLSNAKKVGIDKLDAYMTSAYNKYLPKYQAALKKEK